mgnify:FL=1
MTDSKNDRLIVEVDSDLEDLIDDYLVNRNKEVVDIEKALMTKDFEQVRKIAHDLIGSGKTFGFDFISELGQKIHEGSKENSVEKVQEHSTKLKGLLKIVEIKFVEED